MTSSYDLAMKLSPCAFVATYAKGLHCTAHGVEVRHIPVTNKCDGFYKNLELIDKFYAEVYRAGVRAARLDT